MGYRLKRDIADTTVRVVVGDHQGIADVRSVSARGLRIETAFEAEVGDPISVQLRDRQFWGRIVWISDDATGVAFPSPLSSRDLSMFTGHVDRSLTPGRSKIGFAARSGLRR